MTTTTTRRPIQTNAMAYLSDHYQDAPITLNLSQTVWDWSAYEIVHTTSTGFHLTAVEAQEIINALSLTLSKLDN